MSINNINCNKLLSSYNVLKNRALNLSIEIDSTLEGFDFTELPDLDDLSISLDIDPIEVPGIEEILSDLSDLINTCPAIASVVPDDSINAMNGFLEKVENIRTTTFGKKTYTLDWETNIGIPVQPVIDEINMALEFPLELRKNIVDFQKNVVEEELSNILGEVSGGIMKGLKGLGDTFSEFNVYSMMSSLNDMENCLTSVCNLLESGETVYDSISETMRFDGSGLDLTSISEEQSLDTDKFNNAVSSYKDKFSNVANLL